MSSTPNGRAIKTGINEHKYNIVHQIKTCGFVEHCVWIYTDNAVVLHYVERKEENYDCWKTSQLKS